MQKLIGSNVCDTSQTLKFVKPTKLQKSKYPKIKHFFFFQKIYSLNITGYNTTKQFSSEGNLKKGKCDQISIFTFNHTKLILVLMNPIIRHKFHT